SYGMSPSYISSSFLHAPPTVFGTLSLHDALPIWLPCATPMWTHCPIYKYGRCVGCVAWMIWGAPRRVGRRWLKMKPLSRRTSTRSEEHTSELQSRFDLVCRHLLEKRHSGPHGGRK